MSFTNVPATPFLKWAGGKARLLAQYRPHLPASFGRYFEPFIGGGAVYFDLANRGLLRNGATISDANEDLVNVYRIIQDDVEALVKELLKGPYEYTSSIYYEIRAWVPEKLPAVKRAARLIFLNRTGFNGLYRTNSKGQFNVPFGRFTNPKIVDPPLLRSVAKALRGTEIACRPFEAVLDEARSGDFVYFDPPYVPLSKSAFFTSYAKGDFREADQRRLGEVVRALLSRGVAVRVSNSDTPLVREIYAGLPMAQVSAARSINSKASRRGPITELLVGASTPSS
ncbi:MAG: DNA adenine methylase [Acidobacteriota bacterium]